MIVQPFIDGDHYSLSVFFSNRNFRLLTINKQNIGTTNCMLRLKSLIINVNQNLYLDILPIISNIKNYESSTTVLGLSRGIFLKPFLEASSIDKGETARGSGFKFPLVISTSIKA